MKHFRITRILSILLVLMMVFSSAGCGNDSQNVTKPTDAGKTTETAASSQDAKTIDPLGKYDPAIELTTIRKDLGTNYKYDQGESIDNNVWYTGYKETLGINLKNLWVVADDQYNQKFSVAVAAGDLPDVYTVYSPKDLQMLYSNEMIADLTNVVEQYASPLTKDILSRDGGMGINTASFKGKLMAIPETNSVADQTEMIWIRNDWLKKLNLSAPKTMDELLNVMNAFVTQDPDGNGKKDTYGLAACKGFVNTSNAASGYGPGIKGWADISGFFYSYHAYPDGWIKDAAGNLAYGTIQPEMKAPLMKLQEMYKAGLIDPEFAVKDDTKVGEDANAGKVGIAFGQNWNSLWPLQTSKDNDPTVDWVAIPMVSIDNMPALPLVTSPIYKWHVVNKKCKNPEALVKMTNLWVDKNYGSNPETTKYTSSPEGKEIFKMALFHIWPPTKNNVDSIAVNDAITTKDASKLDSTQKNYYDNTVKYLNGDVKGWPLAAVFGPGGSQTICIAADKGKSWVVSEFFGSPTQTQIDRDATLKKMRDETFTQIIMGKASIDEFDKFVQQWKKLGGDQITNEINEWYQAKK